MRFILERTRSKRKLHPRKGTYANTDFVRIPPRNFARDAYFSPVLSFRGRSAIAANDLGQIGYRCRRFVQPGGLVGAAAIPAGVGILFARCRH